MSDKAAASGKERKPRQMPSSFTILFGCLLLVAIASWVVSSFSPDVQAATLGNFMASPFLGFESAMQVCVFILVLGGFLGVVQKTGALDTGIAVLVRKLGGNDLLLVPVLMLAFGICGSTYGMLEESVPFYLLLASVTFAMGWDPLVGCMVVLMGCGLGVLGSTVNPFSTGLALDALKAAGIPYDQGLMIGIGLVMFAIAEISGIIFVMRYAKRVRTDRAASSLTPEEWETAERLYGDKNGDSAEDAHVELSKIQKRVLVLFALTFVVMIIGFIPWQTFGVGLFDIGAKGDDLSTAWSALLTGLPLGQWYFTECGIWFFTMTIIIGKVAGMQEKELVDTILHGCADLVSVHHRTRCVDPHQRRQRARRRIRHSLCPALLCALLCPVFPHPLEYGHGNRLDAYHGTVGGILRLCPRSHGRNLPRHTRRCSDDHSHMRVHHGWPRACPGKLRDLHQDGRQIHGPAYRDYRFVCHRADARFVIGGRTTNHIF